MNVQKLVIAVFAMGLVMSLLKLVPILFLKRKIKNRFLQSFLAYIPFAVLTSMTFPEVFHSTSSVISASISLVAAVVLAYFGQSLIVVALSSTAVAFVVEQVMKFIS